ncbi:MAG TPA: hypothetical protein PK970_05175, partial [Hyphomicrobiaceae bacterium]|nr:hypothetical protein [Hyphomicrobiaceae bacterium]
LVAVIDDAPVRMSDNDTLEIAVPVSIRERASADGAQQHVMTLRRSRERVRPDFGLMLHDDGDNTFIDGAAGVSTRRIEEHMRQIVDSPIKTVSYCIGTGVLFYPTRVGSSLGWRQTPFDTRAGWERIEYVRAGLARGEDPIRAGMAVLKQNGRIGLLSHRLSDAHFIKTPDTYPLVPKFYLDNRSLIIGRDKSPVQNDADYGNMLDFTHAAVRKYNYDIMAEAATRYQDVIGGIEIDFVRGQFLFPRGKGPERAYLITKLVEEVRAHLDGLAAKNKRPYYLAVRVPPSLETSMWAGLDVKTWMQRDLVDVVIPSQLMTIAGDQPVDDFVRIGRATGVKVHPAILSRQNASWPMADDPRRTGPRGNEAPAARAEDVIGVASNYYSMGADGLQLYNWAARAWVASPWFKTMTRQIATASSVTQHDAVFSVPPAYYFDVENTYEPRKQIPAKLTPGAPQQLTLFVGADPSKAAPQGVTLRLGFDVASRPGLAVRLDINGTAVPVPRAGEGLIATPASRPASSYVAPRHYAPPGSFLYVPVDPKVLRAGANTVQVVVNEPVTLMEFRLAMRRGR